MIFTEFRFFFFFLIAFSVYWLLQSNTPRKIWLWICSYVFYAAWDWRFLSLLVVSTVIDYTAGVMLSRPGVPQPRRKMWLIVSLVSNLGLLGFFKYFNFFTESAAQFLDFLGLPVGHQTLNILLPAGISFYTFQTMSYTIDVYWGQLKAANFLDFGLFVSFFPQLVAGPIVRAADFLPQLTQIRRFADVDVRGSLILFLIGYIKKACIADNLAPFVDQYFTNPTAYNSFSAWTGVIAYAVQIYGDFSGYSDMAIASAGLLGYKFCTNFNFPYLASSVTDFWRRWHMSLSTWLKDYLYIPLGGNRGTKLFTYRNLMITMLLGGLWHGAAWNFIIWGGLHGAALVVHKEWSNLAKRWPLLQSISASLGPVLTFYFVCCTWIFFRAKDFDTAFTVLKSFVLMNSQGDQSLPVMLAIVLAALAVCQWMAAKSGFTVPKLMQLPMPVFASSYGCILAGAFAMASTSYVPFIYFRF
jgi:alginate O-acetyltransferase complex protein AlgI